MSVSVLDASAMVAYLAGEQGSSVVASLLTNANTTCYAPALNLCEVYYDALRRTDLQLARAAIESLYADGVIERRDLSRRF